MILTFLESEISLRQLLKTIDDISEYSTLYINIIISPEKQRAEQQLNNMENFKYVDLDKDKDIETKIKTQQLI